VQFGTGGSRMGFLRLIWDFQAGWQRFWRSTCTIESVLGPKWSSPKGAQGADQAGIKVP
jgi:hypothetical protein